MVTYTGVNIYILFVVIVQSLNIVLAGMQASIFCVGTNPRKN